MKNDIIIKCLYVQISALFFIFLSQLPFNSELNSEVEWLRLQPDYELASVRVKYQTYETAVCVHSVVAKAGGNFS